MDQIENCTICLEIIGESTATLVPCSHQFCFKCIKSWFESKHQCPICNQSVESVKKCNDTSDSVTPISHFQIKQSSNKQQETFDCLDHHYFRIEIKKIYERTKKMEFQIQKTINRKEPDEIKAWAIDTISHRIEELLEQMQQLRPFDPSELLDELYFFEERLNNVEKGNIKEIKIEYYDALDYQDEIYSDNYYYYDNFDDSITQKYNQFQDDFISKGIKIKVSSSNNSKKKPKSSK